MYVCTYVCMYARNKFLAFEMSCYRRILKVCWKDKVGNEVIREKARKVAVGYEAKTTQTFGHVCRTEDQRLIRM